MRVAASIFLVAGLAYLGWDIRLTIAGGVRLGTWLMGLFAAALLYQAYALFFVKPGARLGGIVSSSALAICFAVIAYLLVAPHFPQSLYSLPTDILPMFTAVVLVSLAFAVAAILLVLTKRAAP